MVISSKEILISIIVPCYRQSHYLSDCLGSLIDQTYIFWEAIVVNDGSDDDTDEVANKWAKIDHRIKYIFKENGGLSSARNCGLLHAKGEFLIFLDADDWLEKNALECIIKILEKDLKYDLLLYGYRYADSKTTNSISTVSVFPSDVSLKRILQSNIGPVHTFIISKNFVDKIGQFDETLLSAEDWDFWIRAFKFKPKTGICSKCLAFYRITPFSMSRNPFRMYKALKTVSLRALKKDLRLPFDLPTNRDYSEILPDKVIQRSLAMCLGVSIMQGKIDESLEIFKSETRKLSLKWAPNDFKPMCSYLSFRYKYSKIDIFWIFDEIYPKFQHFFELLEFSENEKNAALVAIFQRYFKLKNMYRFGFLGKIFNLLKIYII